MGASSTRRVRRLPPAPGAAVAAVAGASYLAFALGLVTDAGPLLLVAIGVLPWVVVLARPVRWAYGHHGWLALLHVLVVLQGAALVEFAVQHRATDATADGVVQVVLAALLVVGLAVLTVPFGDNLWLRVGVAITALHVAEHAVLSLPGVLGGSWGSDGLLAEGGAIAGGLPLSHEQLHVGLALVGSLVVFTGLARALRTERERWARGSHPATLPAAPPPSEVDVRRPAGARVGRPG